MASSVAAVYQTSGDNSSDNDSSPLRLLPAPTEAQRGMGVVMESIILTEKDIPGVMLAEPFDKHTIPELRWWLLCRGVTVKKSLKKAEIIQR